MSDSYFVMESGWRRATCTHSSFHAMFRAVLVLLAGGLLSTTVLAAAGEPIMRVHAQDGIMDLIESNLCAAVPPCTRYDSHCTGVQEPVSTLEDRYFINSGPPPPAADTNSSSTSSPKNMSVSDIVEHINSFNTGPQWLSHTEAQQLMDFIWANSTGYGGRGMSREYTYGEVLVEGIKTLYEVLPLEPSSRVLDLGSGVGKFTVYTALMWNISLSWGIEIVDHRYAKSVDCVLKLQEMQDSVWHSPIRFSIMDFAALQHFGTTTHIYMCSTCFGTELVDRILEIASQTPSVKYIISARALGASQRNGFAHFASVRVPCSWSASTTFVIYCRGCSAADADASAYLSYSSRLLHGSPAQQQQQHTTGSGSGGTASGAYPSSSSSSAPSSSAGGSRSGRWDHLAHLVGQQQRVGVGVGVGVGSRAASSSTQSGSSALAWDSHHRLQEQEQRTAATVPAPASPLEQIVSQPWWSRSFLRRRVLSQLFRQAFGCSTRAAEFVPASRDEIGATFPDFLEHHSFQYVFVWRPPDPCDLSVDPVPERTSTNQNSSDVQQEVGTGQPEDEPQQDPLGVEEDPAVIAAEEAARRRLKSLSIQASTESPMVLQVLSKAEACFFLGTGCDTLWAGPLTNPKDRGRSHLKSLASFGMIPKELSSAVRAGKFPTSPLDFEVHVRALPPRNPEALTQDMQRESNDDGARIEESGEASGSTNPLLGEDDQGLENSEQSDNSLLHVLRFIYGHLL